MKVVSLVALLLLTLCSSSPAWAGGEWRLWKAGLLIEISLEDKLYRTSDGSIYVHVRASNVSENAVGVDLRGPYRLVYPNQWTTGPRPERGVVDERWEPFDPLSPSQSQDLKEDFRGRRLEVLEAGQSVDFFTRFNGTAGSYEVDKVAQGYLILSLSGGLRVTNGRVCEALGRAKDDLTECDQAWPLPLVWRDLPVGARLAPER